MNADDLYDALRGYVEAYSRGDLAWCLRELHRLQASANEHFAARLDEADELGVTWDDIGQVFALDGGRAWTQYGGLHGPDRPF